MNTCDIDVLRQRLRYEDGQLFWIVCEKSKQSRMAGKVAGSRKPNSAGYITVCVDGVAYQAHRVIWALVYGEWPNGWIDHKNRIRTDNRIENLRCGTISQHMANNCGYKKASAMPKGVTPQRGKYRERIRVNGKCESLGYFDSPEAAHAAYCDAAHKHFGEFASYGS